jgi:hypothetical protein
MTEYDDGVTMWLVDRECSPRFAEDCVGEAEGPAWHLIREASAHVCAVLAGKYIGRWE